MNKSRRKVSTTVYLDKRQSDQLRALREKTKVPVAEYIRQGIDTILKVYDTTAIPSHSPKDGT